MADHGILATDRAIHSIRRYAEQHPDKLSEAGKGVWREIESRIEDETQRKRGGVEHELRILHHARQHVLDPEHVVPDDVRRDFCWGDRLNVMKRRQRDKHDLDRVSAKSVLLDAQQLAIEKEPEKARTLGETLREQLKTLANRLDPEAQRNLVVSESWVIAELISREVAELERVRTTKQWLRIAVLLLMAESPDTGSMDLGFPEDIAVERAPSESSLLASRDAIRWLATDILTSRCEEGYALLVQRTALKLEARAGAESATGKAHRQEAAAPRSRKRSEAPAPEGWFWLLNVQELFGVAKSTADEWTKKAKWGPDKRYVDGELRLTCLRIDAFENLMIEKGKTPPSPTKSDQV